MFSFLVGGFVGLLVGWAVPRPTWAETLLARIKGLFQKNTDA